MPVLAKSMKWKENEEQLSLMTGCHDKFTKAEEPASPSSFVLRREVAYSNMGKKIWMSRN